MRAIRTSGSRSGTWKRSRAELLRHRQTKGPATDRLHLKYDISSTYAYKLKDRALEVLREGIGRPVGRVDPQSERLQKRVADLEQLAGDQALAIRYLKKTRGHE
jgi:hypothetical protein